MNRQVKQEQVEYLFGNCIQHGTYCDGRVVNTDGGGVRYDYLLAEYGQIELAMIAIDRIGYVCWICCVCCRFYCHFGYFFSMLQDSNTEYVPKWTKICYTSD